jgi:hypothetical protein
LWRCFVVRAFTKSFSFRFTNRNVAKLIAILESIDRELPDWLTAGETRRFSAQLADGTPITVVESEFEDERVEEAMLLMSELLLPERYYAHVVFKGSLLVAFRNCRFRLRRGDLRTVDLCRNVGMMLGIPAQEMQFDLMFDIDHPDFLGDTGLSEIAQPGPRGTV